MGDNQNRISVEVDKRCEETGDAADEPRPSSIEGLGGAIPNKKCAVKSTQVQGVPGASTVHTEYQYYSTDRNRGMYQGDSGVSHWCSL